MRANRAENDLANIGVEGVLSAWDEILSPDCEGAAPGQPLRPIAETREGDRVLYTAFPDYHRTFHNIVVEPPFAAVQWTMTGTQQGEFLGQPASGRAASLSAMSLFEFVGGRVRRWWIYANPPQLEG